MQQRERIKFQCYNCPNTYSLTKPLEDGERPRLFVTCPFCGAQSVVDLAPHRRSKSDTVMKGSDDNAETGQTHFVLPAVVQTEPAPPQRN